MRAETACWWWARRGLRRWRVCVRLHPEMTFLVPGIGAQGGDVEATVRAGLRADGKGLVISSSRAILYADDPAGEARRTRDAINEARERMHGGR